MRGRVTSHSRVEIHLLMRFRLVSEFWEGFSSTYDHACTLLYAEPVLGCTRFGLNLTFWAETWKIAVLIRNICMELVYVVCSYRLSSAHGNAKMALLYDVFV